MCIKKIQAFELQYKDPLYLYLLENTQYISILLFVNKLLFDTEIILSLVQVGPAGSTTNIFGPVLFCGFLNIKKLFFQETNFYWSFYFTACKRFPMEKCPNLHIF